jgi:aminoglycoside phosphotransferase (APT) family kinase protein
VLAPQLPLPIPTPVAQGEPDEGYPYRWSVYRWLEGSLAASAPIGDPVAFATDLAGFLRALEAVDSTGGPEPGQHNFFRGGPLAYYEGEALEAIERLGEEIPRDAVQRTWADAMASEWERDPVWFHGDVAAGNLLVRGRRLGAVIDFGSSGVGDPACDMAIAWTFLSGEARDRFRTERGVDAATWSRGRGWTLWKSLITMVGALEEDDDEALAARRREIDVITSDFAAER